MSRTPIVSGNWKMHKTRGEACQACRTLLERIPQRPAVEVIVFPAFTSLSEVARVVDGSPVALGGQNAHWADEGAFTGEISVPMLEDCGCTHVLLGHSETRQFLGESDERVNRKLARVLESPLTPVVCVGESLEQREAGRARDVVLGQLEKAVAGIDPQRLTRLILAYEPVWAIGTGRTATPEIAQEVHSLIRQWLSGLSGDLAAQVRILYGGSVKPANVRELMAQKDIDGALVGGASLDPESFATLVNLAGES